jgi:4-hydroxybenzoate polyprenyltransferase
MQPHEPDTEPDETSERDLPTSLVPRWLAWIVLVALLGAGAASAWILLQPA